LLFDGYEHSKCDIDEMVVAAGRICTGREREKERKEMSLSQSAEWGL
jgi:hypothetical protein